MLIGFFNNHLVLRTLVDGSTFLEHLQRVHEVLKAARGHPSKGSRRAYQRAPTSTLARPANAACSDASLICSARKKVVTAVR